MKLVIDGFNAIYKFQEIEHLMYEKKLEKAIEKFTSFMVILKNKYKKPLEIYIFYDGKKRIGDDTYQELIDGVNVFYTHENSADSLIENFLRLKKEKKVTDILVITSDKKVQKMAKSYKYKYQTSEEFYKWYNQQVNTNPNKDEKPEKLNDKEINYWLNLFKKK